MTITHHPQFESLMSCSAGSMPEPFAAVMASHMEMCGDCRNELAMMQLIGIELFENISPAELMREAPLNTLRRAESDVETETPRPIAGDVPHALTAHAAKYLDDIPWSSLASGIKHYRIPLLKPASGDLRLIKVAPGAALPEHGHGGSELTLVLRGSYSDKTGTYHVGDVADLGDTIEHQPLADPKEGCICLIASDKKIRFKSMLARLVQPFTGM
jgi:putative transcriptional regulator